jgi:MFS family permease
LLFLAEVGFSDEMIGLCLSLTLAGDLGITLALTTHADRVGRRKVLSLGAVLMVAAGIAHALSSNFYLTVLAGILGVITPTGNEIGPFVAIEQAALSDITARDEISTMFGWYQFVGASSQAAGAFAAGWSVSALQGAGYSTLAAHQFVILGYAGLGILLGLLYCSLSGSVEASVPPGLTRPARKTLDLGLSSRRSRQIVMQLRSGFGCLV